MINIVIPMAGRGSRFVAEGYNTPKPLIKIFDRPMISLVVKNLKPKEAHRFIFVCLEEHMKNYDLVKYLKGLEPTCEVVPVKSVTEGAACTVLLAKDLINNADQLMIANSDQWISFDINEYLNLMKENVDGLIMTMTADDKKWSFVALDNEKSVTRVAEKEVISNEATVGIYNFKKGSDFVNAAEVMIKKDLRSNGEFYVAPVYNELINDGDIIKIFNIGSEANGMYGLGIPEDLKKFIGFVESNKISINKL